MYEFHLLSVVFLACYIAAIKRILQNMGEIDMLNGYLYFGMEVRVYYGHTKILWYRKRKSFKMRGEAKVRKRADNGIENIDTFMS